MHIDYFRETHKLIQPWLYRTPLITNDSLNRLLGRKIYFKCENFQVTGSFKIRGCLSSLLKGDKQPRITRSSGNFAQAMAWAGQKLDIPITVVMPENASPMKVQNSLIHGAEVVLSGWNNPECDLKVEELMSQRSMRYTSTNNDDDVIMGQGTVALEIYEELPSVKHFVCPLGGGGIAGGCAAVFKQLNPDIEVFGIEPEGGQDYFISRKAGVITSVPEVKTIADGLRAVCVGERNWPLLQKYIDHVFLATDQQIIDAMKMIFQCLGIIAEPSAAITFAGVLANLDAMNKGDIVCVITGGNIDRDVFLKYLTE